MDTLNTVSQIDTINILNAINGDHKTLLATVITITIGAIIRFIEKRKLKKKQNN
jgi:putative flippase GtrA